MDFLRNIPDKRNSALLTDEEKEVEIPDYNIPLSLYLENRLRVLDAFKEKPNSVILLAGSRLNSKSQIQKPFRQDPYFLWMFGVSEPGFWGALHTKSRKSYLYSPQCRSKSQCTECHGIGDVDFLRGRYGVDVVRQLSDMESDLADLHPTDIVVLLRKGCEKVDFPTMKCFKIDDESLLPALLELRLKKTKEEIELLRFLASLTSEAMRFIMKFMRPGTQGYAAESMFRYYIQYIGNCREVARLPICTTVKNFIQNKHCPLAMPNSHIIADGDMCYCEMGPCYNGFRTQLITTFPINGVFNNIQRQVHDMVVGMREMMLKKLQPPIKVKYFVREAQKALAEKLVEADIIKGPVDKLVRDGTLNYFFKHPLFEMVDKELLIDYKVFSVYSTDFIMPNCSYLMGSLEPEMIITLTSQCFFSHEKSENVGKCIKERGLEFMDHGAVVQDVVLLKRKGYEILSTNPITADEIEELQTKIDFQNRKGRGLDITKGRFLFPDPDKIIESNVWEIKNKLMKDKQNKLDT